MSIHIIIALNRNLERLLLQDLPQAPHRKPDKTNTCSKTSSYLETFCFNQLCSNPGHYKLFFILWWKCIQSSVIIIISRSTYAVQMSKVSSDTQRKMLKATSCKIRKQIISFHHTMAQNSPSHCNRLDWAYIEGSLDRGKKYTRTNTKSRRCVLNTLDFTFKRIRWPSSCNFTYISQFVYFLSLYASLHAD